MLVSHDVNVNMVEVAVDDEDENENALSFGIRCFICKELLSAPFVSGMGVKADMPIRRLIFSDMTHVCEVHIEGHVKRVTRSSKKSIKTKRLKLKRFDKDQRCE